MALTRVQTTPKVHADSASSVSVTFAAPPTVGNAVVVGLIGWNVATPLTITDNRGNSYTTAITRSQFSAGVAVAFCPRVATTGAPFTVTITAASGGGYFTAVAIEVTGLGAADLAVDASASNVGSGTAVTTGTTAALAADDVFLVIVESVDGGSTTITVESVSPAWTEEAESPTAGHSVGEIDSRSRTGVVGTTQSGAWTHGTSWNWAAAIVAFKTTAAPAVVDARLTQAPVELLHQYDAPPTRTSQLPVEIIHQYTPSVLPARVSHAPLEVIHQYAPSILPARVSQAALEIIYPFGCYVYAPPTSCVVDFPIGPDTGGIGLKVDFPVDNDNWT